MARVFLRGDDIGDSGASDARARGRGGIGCGARDVMAFGRRALAIWNRTVQAIFFWKS